LATGHTHHHIHLRPFLPVIVALMVLLAACGGDDTDVEDLEITDSAPTPTERAAQATATPAPTATEAPAEPTPAPDPTPTEPVEEPTPEPADDVELAPQLAGLTDWRNIEPVTLEDLRGEPVVLVFWNSI
jgi:hypothetical protein